MTMNDWTAFADAETAKWWVQRKAMSMLLDETHAVMTRAEFNHLLEYSTSLPSGTFAGKLWKRHIWEPTRPGGNMLNGGWRWTEAWWLGEYVPVDDPGEIGIVWREILLCDG